IPPTPQRPMSLKISHLGIFARLCVLLATGTIGLILAIGLLLHQQRAIMLQDHSEQIRNLTEVAHGVLSHFEALARQGTLAEEDAKQQALATLRAPRSQEHEGFFVHDLEYRTVMDPANPALEGQSQRQGAQRMIQELVSAARSQGSGFLEYSAPTGSGQSVENLAFVQLFRPWGWVIGTGIRLDEIDAAFWQSIRNVVPWLVLTGILLAAIAVWVAQSILRPMRMLREFNAVMAHIEKDGDLSRTITVSGDDEISTTGRAFNGLVASLRASMRTVQEQIARVKGASSKVRDEIAFVRSSATGQAEEASATSAGMEELSASVNHIADKTNETARTAGRACQEANGGEGQIQGLVAHMNRIADSVASASRTIEALGARSQEITNIVKTIKDIADQTNLLALNAAIEAARAGEQGRGFAVVADEVRKLAERSANATTEIGSMIDSIQEETARVVASMKTGGEFVQQGVGQVSQAGDAISRIGAAVREIVQLADEVAASVRQQSAASQDIAARMERIAHTVEKTDAAAA